MRVLRGHGIRRKCRKSRVSENPVKSDSSRTPAKAGNLPPDSNPAGIVRPQAWQKAGAGAGAAEGKASSQTTSEGGPFLRRHSHPLRCYPCHSKRRSTRATRRLARCPTGAASRGLRPSDLVCRRSPTWARSSSCGSRGGSALGKELRRNSLEASCHPRRRRVTAAGAGETAARSYLAALGVVACAGVFGRLCFASHAKIDSPASSATRLL